MTAHPLRSLIPIIVVILGIAVIAVAIALIVEPGDAEDFPEDSPEGTVQRYLRALNERDFDSAYSMLSDGARDDLSLGDYRSIHRWSTWDEGQQRVRLDDVQITDDRALVDVTVERSTGSGISSSRYSYTRVIPLVWEDEQWKIDDPYVDIASKVDTREAVA